MDETYVGGKPRPENNKDDDMQAPRGRGTSKIPVVGMVERGGNVKAKSVSKDELHFADLAGLVRKGIDLANTMLITDEYPGYKGMKTLLAHKAINHSKMYAD